MKCDIVLAGVGGQGVLTLAAAIASGALEENLCVKQSEVHGMAQRGGAVMATLRLADRHIASDLIPLGTASIILSMEPMESLRYLPYLSKEGTLITSDSPVRNIPDYPDLKELLAKIRSLPSAVVVDAVKLARTAGSTRAANMVMVGAAMNLLPVKAETVERAVRVMFARKGDQVVDINLRALQAGCAAAAQS
ncbi:MAG TPA: indolepyruvate oxidoreductase subunit beta [Acidobacteriota bacterium]|nr:indolepyruvate oxidoreductase subunit beta [Acidobacteriota bacterium]